LLSSNISSPKYDASTPKGGSAIQTRQPDPTKIASYFIIDHGRANLQFHASISWQLIWDMTGSGTLRHLEMLG
jgi:hypothetical protein